jgi:hypothetical protein
MFSPDDLLDLTAAGVTLPKEVADAQQLAEELQFTTLPDVLDAMFSEPVWDPAATNVENLRAIATAALNRSQRALVADELEKTIKARLVAAVKRNRVPIFDAGFEFVHKLKAEVAILLEDDAVARLVGTEAVNLNSITADHARLAPKVAQVDALTAALEQAFNALLDLLTADGTDTGEWMIKNPRQISVGLWVRMDGTPHRGVARARGGVKAILDPVPGWRVLDAVGIPESFAELEARRQLLLRAERNAGGFYEDDDRLIGVLADGNQPIDTSTRMTTSHGIPAGRPYSSEAAIDDLHERRRNNQDPAQLASQIPRNGMS